jgi:hypothetical protein
MSDLELKLLQKNSVDLCVRAAALNLFIDRIDLTDKINREYYTSVYLDLKLSIMLSEETPYVCLLYNNGDKIPDPKLKSFLKKREYLGFAIHSTNTCKDHNS